MARIKELFEMYKDVDEEKLFNNLVYFLKAIQPVCEKYDIRMAIHPDDPAWPVFGLSVSLPIRAPLKTDEGSRCTI